MLYVILLLVGTIIGFLLSSLLIIGVIDAFTDEKKHKNLIVFFTHLRDYHNENK